MNYLPSTASLLGAAYRDALIDYDAGYSMSRDLETIQMRGQFVVAPRQSYL